MLPGKMRTATPSVDVERAEARARRGERERTTRALQTGARRGLAAARAGTPHAPSRPAPPSRARSACTAHLSLSPAL